MAKTPSTRDHKTAARHSKASDASRRGARKQTARAKSKTVTTQRAAFLRRAVKLINDAAGQLDGTREAIKKMFGPLTPAERRDLRAGTKMAARGLDKLLRLLIKPRKRAGSGRPKRKA